MDQRRQVVVVEAHGRIARVRVGLGGESYRVARLVHDRRAFRHAVDIILRMEQVEGVSCLVDQCPQEGLRHLPQLLAAGRLVDQVDVR